MKARALSMLLKKDDQPQQARDLVTAAAVIRELLRYINSSDVITIEVNGN
jgi:hypothetical protein